LRNQTVDRVRNALVDYTEVDCQSLAYVCFIAPTDYLIN